MQNPSVLRRKLRSDPKGSDDQAVSPAKAARVGLARAADTAFNLALRVNGIRQSRLDLAEVVEQLDETWALFPLLHDDGSVGVMCLEPSCIVAFVERQTLGRVNAEAGETRRLTSTDKALATSFVDGFLRQFDDALNGAPTAYWTCGYRAEDAVSSRHMMVLQLDGSEFRGFDMTSEVVEAQMSVNMRLFLPIKEKATSKNSSAKGQNPKVAKSQLGDGQTMRSSAMAASVEMDAIMCKVLLPLSELNSLQPGQLVNLPQNAVQQAHLVDKTGRTAQMVRLGQLHGMRAVRLIRDVDQEGQAKKETAHSLKPERAKVNQRQIQEKQPVPEQDQIIAKSEAEISTEPDDNPKDELDMLLAAGKN